MRAILCRLAVICTIFVTVTTTTVGATQVSSPLVDDAWLAANLGKVLVLDLRDMSPPPAAVMNPCAAGAKKPQGVAGHIPGSSVIDWKTARSDQMTDHGKLVGMLPAKSDFEALMRKNGVNNDSAIVLVTQGIGPGDMSFATRFYWQVKFYGHDNVAILNGGLTKWAENKRELSQAPAIPPMGNFTATAARNELLAKVSDVTAAIGGAGQLIDSRSPAAFSGAEKKPFVNASGHIPTARNIPHPAMFTATSPATFRPAAEIVETFKKAGINPSAPVVTYCDSGQVSASEWFVLHELLGNASVKLYDGSMNEWAMDSARSVEK